MRCDCLTIEHRPALRKPCKGSAQFTKITQWSASEDAWTDGLVHVPYYRCALIDVKSYSTSRSGDSVLWIRKGYSAERHGGKYHGG